MLYAIKSAQANVTFFSDFQQCDTILDNNGESGEKDAQVKILIQHLLMALRGVYYTSIIVDNPVGIYFIFTEYVIMQHYVANSLENSIGQGYNTNSSAEFYLCFDPSLLGPCDQPGPTPMSQG